MYVYHLVGGENHPVYQRLADENLERQYSFLRSAVSVALELDRPLLSVELIRALNHHAIAGLHAYAGQYRPCAVSVKGYKVVEHYQVPALMEMFVEEVNRLWAMTSPTVLACLVFKRLVAIHPFINGNGKTARAVSYYVLCLKFGAWLPGEVILPELFRNNMEECIRAQLAGDELTEAGQPNLAELHAFLVRLLREQLLSAPDGARFLAMDSSLAGAAEAGRG